MSSLQQEECILAGTEKNHMCEKEMMHLNNDVDKRQKEEEEEEEERGAIEIFELNQPTPSRGILESFRNLLKGDFCSPSPKRKQEQELYHDHDQQPRQLQYFNDDNTQNKATICDDDKSNPERSCAMLLTTHSSTTIPSLVDGTGTENSDETKDKDNNNKEPISTTTTTTTTMSSFSTTIPSFVEEVVDATANSDGTRSKDDNNDIASTTTTLSSKVVEAVGQKKPEVMIKETEVTKADTTMETASVVENTTAMENKENEVDVAMDSLLAHPSLEGSPMTIDKTDSILSCPSCKESRAVMDDASSSSTYCCCSNKKEEKEEEGDTDPGLDRDLYTKNSETSEDNVDFSNITSRVSDDTEDTVESAESFEDGMDNMMMDTAAATKCCPENQSKLWLEWILTNEPYPWMSLSNWKILFHDNNNNNHGRALVAFVFSLIFAVFVSKCCCGFDLMPEKFCVP